MQCLEQLRNYNIAPEQQAVIDVQLGNYSYQTGDVVSAIDWYRQATRLIVTSQGDERLLFTCLANLECVLGKHGDADAASQIHEYRLGRLSDFAEESSTFASTHYQSEACAGPRSGSQQTLDWLWKA